MFDRLCVAMVAADTETTNRRQVLGGAAALVATLGVFDNTALAASRPFFHFWGCFSLSVDVLASFTAMGCLFYKISQDDFFVFNEEVLFHTIWQGHQLQIPPQKVDKLGV